MLTAFVSRTKALVGLNNNLQEPIDRPNIFLPHPAVPSVANDNDESSATIQGNVFDCIRTIKDPEKPATLEDLEVVYESGIKVTNMGGNRSYVVNIEFNPTVPHCSLATLIGLCMRVKVERCLVEKIKLDIYIKKGAHDTEEEINKQINDKERVAAAMENPSLREMVEKCIKEEDS